MIDNNHYKEITIVVVLYEEKQDLVLNFLENIKKFKIIIIDNAENFQLKKKNRKKI